VYSKEERQDSLIAEIRTIGQCQVSSITFQLFNWKMVVQGYKQAIKQGSGLV